MSCAARMNGGKRRRGTRKQRGGDSAWQSVMNAVGGGETQWQNVFGPGSRAMGNGITHANGQPNTNMSAMNSSKVGGRRRRRGKRGGNWGATLGTAAVPFGLLALQQTYGRRRKGRKSRRTRRR